MLFDDYIFYKIESHADISEEFEECVPERAPSFTNKNKGETFSVTEELPLGELPPPPCIIFLNDFTAGYRFLRT